MSRKIHVTFFIVLLMCALMFAYDAGVMKGTFAQKTPGEQRLFYNGNVGGVANGGTSPSFVLRQPCKITYIMTYHHNHGRGCPAGTIALRSNSGKVYGPWKATLNRSTRYWEVRPGVVFPAGTYAVLDSSPGTWAQNSGSRGHGMTEIRGIKMRPTHTPSRPTHTPSRPTDTPHGVWVFVKREFKDETGKDSSAYYNHQIKFTQRGSTLYATTSRVCRELNMTGTVQTSHTWSPVPPARLVGGKKMRFKVTASVTGNCSFPRFFSGYTAIDTTFHGGVLVSASTVNWCTTDPAPPSVSKVGEWKVREGSKGQKMIIAYVLLGSGGRGTMIYHYVWKGIGPTHTHSSPTRPSLGSERLTQCMSNCKNIGTALEMYSTDNSGHYPTSLKKLVPNYLKFIPTCAAAGKDTYSQTYESGMNPDWYKFHCSGAHHTKVGDPPNHPQYNSTQGLISTRPPTPSKPTRTPTSSGGQRLTQCMSNCKNIGTALEMYSTDNSGHYPTSLKKLVPDYLKFIPTCAAAGKDTYSATYESGMNPDWYKFHCSGAHHTKVGAPPNYPQYNSTQGLIRR